MAVTGIWIKEGDYPPSFYLKGIDMAKKHKQLLILGRRAGKSYLLKKIHEQFMERRFKYCKNVYRYRCNLEKHFKTKNPKSRHLNLVCKLIRYELRGEGLWSDARRLK